MTTRCDDLMHGWEARKRGRATSYLPFDVDAGKGRGATGFEPLAGFGCEKHNGSFAVLEEVLAVMVEDELRGLDVRLKVELLGDKTQGHIWLVSARRVSNVLVTGRKGNVRLADVAQSSQALPENKHIHEICAHVGRLVVELEEAMVVTQGQGRAHVEGVLDGLVLFLCCG